jgi:hypothetical protein
MKNTIERIESNYHKRLMFLEEDLTTYKDWETLNRVLNLDEMCCFDLFRLTNSSLEEVEKLISLLVNGLRDDSSLAVHISGRKPIPFLYVGWGNDNLPSVSEEDLNKMIDILEQKHSFANTHKYSLMKDYFGEIWKTYSQFSTDLKLLMLSLASEDVKREYKSLTF